MEQQQSQVVTDFYDDNRLSFQILQEFVFLKQSYRALNGGFIKWGLELQQKSSKGQTGILGQCYYCRVRDFSCYARTTMVFQLCIKYVSLSIVGVLFSWVCGGNFSCNPCSFGHFLFALQSIYPRAAVASIVAPH